MIRCDICWGIMGSTDQLAMLGDEWLAAQPDMVHVCKPCVREAGKRLQMLEETMRKDRIARRRSIFHDVVSECFKSKEGEVIVEGPKEVGDGDQRINRDAPGDSE